MTVLPRRRFVYLRHGRTDYNARGLSQGASDIPLNDEGRAQAREAAPLLAGFGLTQIVSSPMSRALETAEIVNETLGLALGTDPDLHEVVFGGQEGKPLAPWFGEWMQGRFTPEGAESFDDLVARAGRAMARVLERPGPLLVVSHGAFFRAVRALMGVDLDVPTPNATPMLCNPMAGGGWHCAPLDTREAA